MICGNLRNQISITLDQSRLNRVEEERIRLTLTLAQLPTWAENTQPQLQVTQTDADRVSVEAEFEQPETAILIANGFSRDRHQLLPALFLGGRC